MHEMGVVINMVKTAEKIARDNGASKVGRLVVQIGELSAVIPKYVEDCYAGAIENTLLSGSELVIEIIPGNGICKECGNVYTLIEHDLKCPKCSSSQWDILSGRDVVIKEIAVY